MREYGPAKHDPGLDDTRRQASFAGNEGVKNTRSRIEQYNLEYFPRQIPHRWCEAGCYVRRASEYSRLVERRLSNTPADLEDGGQEIVLAVPYEIWGFYPETGKLKWYCDGPQSGSMCSSVVAYHGIIYAIESGPDGGGAVAVRAGGKDDVNKTHVIWKGRDRSRIGTPLVDGEYMYWVSGKIANCVDAKTGKRVYQQRLSRSTTSRNQDRQGELGGGRRRFGGRRGGQDYSSLVAAGGKLYYTTRSGELYVLNLGSKFQELAKNRFDDGGDFSATPAISNGEIFIRSSKNLYCVAKTK